jgi:hypothetical protein
LACNIPIPLAASPALKKHAEFDAIPKEIVVQVPDAPEHKAPNIISTPVIFLFLGILAIVI